MKNCNLIKIYCLIILIVASTFQAHAQNAFHVYRNDGTINTFFYSYLDSITYSKCVLENDAEEFIQNFHTPDSIYSIPVNTIDSISFYRPATVYKAGVIRLEDKHIPYIVGRDGLNLQFMGNTPKNLLPQKGDKLVTLEMNEVFPSGFAGEVINVTPTADYYLVECELPLLTDIFSSYYYDGNIELLEEEQKAAPYKNVLAECEDNNQPQIWPPIDTYFNLPTANVSLYAVELGLAAGSAAASVSQTLNCTLQSKMHLRTSLLIQGGIYFDILMTGEHALTTDISTSVTGSISCHRGASISGRPPVAPLIEFYLECGPFFEFSGSLNGKYNQTQYFNSILKYTYDHNHPTNIPNEFRLIPVSRDEPTGEITGEVSLKLGAFVEMGVALISKEIAKAGLALEQGIALNAEINLSDAPSISSPPNTSVYDKHKGENLLTVSCFSGIEFRLKALLAESSRGIESSIGGPLFECGMVPDFNNVESGISQNTVGELYAMADVSRRCLGKSKAGFALYQDDQLIDKSYYGTSYDGHTPLHISHVFKGLKPGLKYTIYPIVELFGNSELLATPSSDTELPVSVTTGTAADITDDSATLFGSTSGIDASVDCQYGIAWRTSTETAWILCAAPTKTGGDFSCNISGLHQGTEYSYRAYLCIDGTYYYGETKTFQTKKKNTINELGTGLTYFYQTANGDNWTNNTGWLKVEDIRTWYGVSIFGDDNFIKLTLPSNYLTGNAVLRDIDNLDEFNLSDNSLSCLTIDGGNLSYPHHYIEDNKDSNLSIYLKNVMMPGCLSLHANNSKMANMEISNCSNIPSTWGESQSIDIGIESPYIDNLKISNSSTIEAIRGFNYDAPNPYLAFMRNIFLTGNEYTNQFCLYNLTANNLTITNSRYTNGDPNLIGFAGCHIDSVSITQSPISIVHIDGGGHIVGTTNYYVRASRIGTLSLDRIEMTERVLIENEGELSTVNISNCQSQNSLDIDTSHTFDVYLTNCHFDTINEIFNSAKCVYHLTNTTIDSIDGYHYPFSFPATLSGTLSQIKEQLIQLESQYY